MSRCSRCGLEEGCGSSLCEASCDDTEELGEATVNCRNRELANLRSLLRSVKVKLEKTAEELEGIAPSVSSESARMLIDQALEALDL